MQERNINTRNISKKRSENIKIPKKTTEKIKDSNNLIMNHNYNNNSINNSILLNKSSSKIDKKANMRNISQSTKCMKTKGDEKEKSNVIFKAKNKYSITREKDRDYNTNVIKKDEKHFKSKKKYMNTKDILLNRNNINNHSFNHFKKMPYLISNNGSLKNIDSSYNNEIYNPSSYKACKIPKFRKYDKKNIFLPFFYHSKKSEIRNNFKRKIIRSKRSDFNNALKDINSISNIDLANKLLSIPERAWIEELKENSALIDKNLNSEKNKNINNENNNTNENSNDNLLNDFIKGRVIIQEDFNWILWSMGIVCWIMIEKNEKYYNNFLFLKSVSNLNLNDITKWKEGFIYNGIYFRLFNKIDNYNNIKIIKREIKSLNLLFLDYIQLLDNIPRNKYSNYSKPLLTSNILFPLISLIELTDYYLLASLALEPSFEKNKIKSFILNEEEYFINNNYYNEVDISNYNTENLKYSPFFANLTDNNLLNLNNGKLLLINVNKDLHPLMIPEKNEMQYNEEIYKNNIYLKYPVITHVVGKEEQVFNKAFLNYFEYFVNYLQNNKYIIDIPNLEYEMNKFGINKCFYLFILSKIKLNNSCDFDTNNNICSLIKIYILVKLLTKIDEIHYSKNSKNNNPNNFNNNKYNIKNESNKDTKSESSYATASHKTNNKSNSRKNIKYSTEKKYLEFNTKMTNSTSNSSNIIKNKNVNINKRGIKFIAQLVLTILNPKSSFIEINIDYLIYKLLFQSNIYLEKFKKLNSKIFSFDVSNLYEPRSFLKSLINSARKNPFIFLKQVENKFNILFNYEVKYRTSICLENFMKYFKNEEHITEKEPQKIYSYIDLEEIGTYLIIKSIYNNLMSNSYKINNNMKKKGNKIIKNISSENMDLLYGRMNYDNFSLLNRSIIHNRNSNFHILNSSKEKSKKHHYNNIPLYTESNSNKNNLLNNDSNTNTKERNNKNKIDTFFSGSNLTSSKNNIESESTNNNEDLLSNNYKTNDNIIKKEENNGLDMYEFGDEESEKSFNFSNEGSSFPQNINKKRNTTNLNNSKFNLNNTNKNDGSSNNKNLNTLNYNTNTTNSNNSNMNLNNKVFNGKNSVNDKNNQSGSANISNNNINIRIKNDYWQLLFNNYHFKFPSNLYKVYTQDFKSNSPIYKYLSMYYSFFSFLPYSSNYFCSTKNNTNNTPKIEQSNISNLLKRQKILLENIFFEIISINNNSAYMLINFYIYYFLNFYLVENDKTKTCEDILGKINVIVNNKIIYKKINYQIIINLLNGLLYSKDNFLKVEEYFTKSLILSLIEYGEPRGRNNDGRSIMMFPVWKTGRNFLIMDNNEIINENFKEMYKTLLHYNENKTRNKNNNLNSYINEGKDWKDFKLIDKNILNDLYRETKYDIKNYKKSKKFNLNLGNGNNNNSKTNSIYTNTNINRLNKPFIPSDNKTGTESYKKQKNNSGFIQNYFQSQNEETLFNFNEEDMLERPSKGNIYDEFNINNKINDDNNFKKSFLNDCKYINTAGNVNNANNKFISRINSEATIKIYFKENSYFPEIKFPSMNDKKSSNINLFFFSDKFFIYLIKSIFSLINFSSGETAFTEDYLKHNIFEENQINNNINNNKKSKFRLEKILNENLYYKKYNQSNILVSFGNNSHCETGHVEYRTVFGKIEYKSLSMPRVLYQLKNKEIISIKSGWEHNVCQDINKMLYSWGNNSRGQCGFGISENVNGIVTYPKNIIELNDKQIKEISCGNEHTLALTKDGDVFSWGSAFDGVLGRELKEEEKGLGIGKPGKITFFIKNDIKIRHISSGSIHNLCLDVKSNLYSWGCSKGGQLGFDEKELEVIYKQNNSSTNTKGEVEKENNFCLREPKLIKSLKDIEIIKISSGEAHNTALSIDGKCYVWGLSSNGQLGLGFCADSFPYGEGLQKSRVFTPTILNDFDKKNDGIIKVFCGKTFTIFLNQKDELFSTGINDLNQCGIDNRFVENINLCNDIVTPIKIEMFIRMKIINISCGESHVLAITEDNGIKMLFSWGSNRFGQLGQGISIKKSLPKIVNYFLHYNNSEVSQVSCGAFHSLVLIKMKNEDKYKPEFGEKYIFGIIDKYEDYTFEI